MSFKSGVKGQGSDW